MLVYFTNVILDDDVCKKFFIYNTIIMLFSNIIYELLWLSFHWKLIFIINIILSFILFLVNCTLINYKDQYLINYLYKQNHDNVINYVEKEMNVEKYKLEMIKNEEIEKAVYTLNICTNYYLKISESIIILCIKLFLIIIEIIYNPVIIPIVLFIIFLIIVNIFISNGKNSEKINFDDLANFNYYFYQNNLNKLKVISKQKLNSIDVSLKVYPNFGYLNFVFSLSYLYFISMFFPEYCDLSITTFLLFFIRNSNNIFSTVQELLSNWKQITSYNDPFKILNRKKFIGSNQIKYKNYIDIDDKIKNYLDYDSILFIGKSGSGKTNLLKSIYYKFINDGNVFDQDYRDYKGYKNHRVDQDYKGYRVDQDYPIKSNDIVDRVDDNCKDYTKTSKDYKDYPIKSNNIINRIDQDYKDYTKTRDYRIDQDYKGYPIKSNDIEKSKTKKNKSKSISFIDSKSLKYIDNEKTIMQFISDEDDFIKINTSLVNELWDCLEINENSFTLDSFIQSYNSISDGEFKRLCLAKYLYFCITKEIEIVIIDEIDQGIHPDLYIKILKDVFKKYKYVNEKNKRFFWIISHSELLKQSDIFTKIINV